MGDLVGYAGGFDGGYGISAAYNRYGSGIFRHGLSDLEGAFGEGRQFENAHGAVPHDGAGAGDFFGKGFDGFGRISSEQPGHPVGGAAMQSAVRGQQPECDPPLEQVGIRSSPKAADVVAPVAEAGHPQGKPAAQVLAHRVEGRFAVAAPVDRKLLRPSSRRAGKDNRLSLAAALAQQLEDGLDRKSF